MPLKLLVILVKRSFANVSIRGDEKRTERGIGQLNRFPFIVGHIAKLEIGVVQLPKGFVGCLGHLTLHG